MTSGTSVLTNTLSVSGALLVLSVLASKASGRLGVPALLLFLVVGMIAGSEGIGGIYFDNYLLANSVGTIALVYILFAGGLDTDWHHVKRAALPAISLATIGVVVTAGLMAVGAHYIAGLSWQLSVLLGAIVSSTDAAAVFGVLRSKGIRLKGNLAALLELESGSNDPMAVFLTVGITGLILAPGSSITALVPTLFIEMIVGTVAGALIGVLAYKLLNRIELDTDGLYPVLTIGLALLAFALPQFLGGNGYLSAYVAGITLGSHRFVHRIYLIQFHEGLGWLMQIAMFLCLGLLVFPSQLLPVAHTAIGSALFLILFARPVAVFCALAPFSLTWREKLLVSWVGLKGAVPIVLATIPVTAGVVGSQGIFTSVFFIVFLSVLLQGISVGWLAKRLDLICSASDGVTSKKVTSSTFQVILPKDSPAVGKKIVDLELPSEILLVMVTRGENAFIPRGDTRFEGGDVILVNDHGVDAQEIKKFFLPDRA